MENCRVLLSPFDSQVRLESLLSFLCTEVLPTPSPYSLEVAQDNDCLSLACGLHDHLPFTTGLVSASWDRPHDHTFLSEFPRVRQLTVELAEGMDLSVQQTDPHMETEDEHRQRVAAAVNVRKAQTEVMVVPVETLKVVCECLNVSTDSIIVIQSKLIRTKKVADLRKFCSVFSMGVFQEETALAGHCAAVLAQYLPPVTEQVVEVTVKDEQIVLKADGRATEQQVCSEAKRLLKIAVDQKSHEEYTYGHRKLFYRTVLRNLQQVWDSVASQLTALAGPPQPALNLSSLQAQIDHLETCRDSDRAYFRSIPSQAEYSDLQQEVDQLRAELTEKCGEYEKVYAHFDLETAALKQLVAGYQSYFSLAPQQPTPQGPPVSLSYGSNTETHYVLLVESSTLLHSVYLEAVSGEDYHRCVSNLTIEPKLTEVLVHRHYFCDAVKFVLRTAEGAVSNELKLPRTELEFEGVRLEEGEMREVEGTLAVLGHDNIKPATIPKIAQLLRTRHLSHLDIVSELCRVTGLS